MDRPIEHRPRRSLLPSAPDLRAADTVDTCRLRLLALRTRIETSWPAAGHLFKRGLGRDNEAVITDLLMALPTPLPLIPGCPPETIFFHSDTDLRVVAGRAVDAALALLDVSSLDVLYVGEVSMLESHRPGALQPIVVVDPSVGLLVATIIGTLEAVWEKVAQPAALVATPAGRGAAAPEAAPSIVQPPHLKSPIRGRVVPRI